jgi:hypothetical protein
MSIVNAQRRRQIRNDFFRQIINLACIATCVIGSATLSAVGHNDRGIGGTGAPMVHNNDRGIGGTGLYGTITAFGSIIVNGKRVALPAKTRVLMDGQARSIDALDVGQIAKVTSTGTDRTLRAQRIEVNRIVIGTVESTSPFRQRIVVLGQTVLLPAGATMPSVGDRVAVDGLRRPDGVISANKISSADTALDQIVGLVARNASGELTIGELRLLGHAGPLADGARVIVRGNQTAAGLQVTNLRSDPLWPGGSGARRLSIESYVSRAGQDIVLGDGLRLPASSSAVTAVPSTADGFGRVIVEIVVNSNGNWQALAVTPSQSSTGNDGGGGPPGGGPPGGGPGGGGPSGGGPAR